MGLGNNVAALGTCKQGGGTGSPEYGIPDALQTSERGAWYESRQAAYGYPHASGNHRCLKICLANLFCNLCCGGGGLCFGGYGGRGMF